MFDLIAKRLQPHEHANLLVVGDGNFSFSSELAHHIRSTIYATSLDLPEKLNKDSLTKSNIERLNTLDHVVTKHGVDATKLEEIFTDIKFHVVIFNFPHVGGKSNIKKCRQLLQDFFISATKVLDVNGCVVTSLCKGQSGLPCDESRGAYGNTWQVSTQASKAGLVLVDLLPFTRGSLTNYEEAGYRGAIHKKFLSTGGLILVYELHGTILNFVDESDVTTDANAKVEVIRRTPSRIYDQLDGLLFSLMQTFVSPYNLTITQLDRTLLQQKVHVTFSNEDVFLAPEFFSNKHSLSALHEGPYKIRYFIPNSGELISPYKYFISNRITYKLKNNRDLSLKVSTWLQTIAFKEFTVTSSACVCSSLKGIGTLDWRCSCDDDVSVMQDKYDMSSVPHFIHNVTSDYILHCSPEVTLHDTKNTNDGETFFTIDPLKYELDERERNYFREVDTTCCNTVKYAIRGLCVVKVTTCTAHDDLYVTFHGDEILLACYGVTDIRCIWSSDVAYQGGLLKCLEEDRECRTIKRREQREQATSRIKYTLCYRHDICFWLRDGNTEEEFLRSVRSITKGFVHSVRLIKILRYNDSGLISYCYRVIYNSVDGALTHLHTVHMQNLLRQHLMAIGFDLR